nr:uncharacterized protein LOC123750685 [Procambarus clarkii]
MRTLLRYKRWEIPRGVTAGEKHDKYRKNVLTDDEADDILVPSALRAPGGGRVWARGDRAAPRPVRPAVTWEAARAGCKKLGGDLIVLDEWEKIQFISRYIDQKFPAESTAGYIYWVGGRTYAGTWKWVNGKLINLKSNVWTPDRPLKDGKERATMLVPVDQTHKRRYLLDYEITRVAPAYICRA